MATDVQHRTGAEPTTLEPGTLRHRIEIQAQSTVTDNFGGIVEVWKTIWTANASIEVLLVKELTSSTSFVSRITHQITLRYPSRAQIAPRMRVVFGNHIYKIEG